jgi:sugar (pentulose or hexulose) kinase
MARAKRYLLLPDYLAYRLTGRAVTDPSTASSTGLYAQDTADYCPEALAAAEIDKGALAEIQTPGQLIARVLPKSAAAWGLDADTVVVTGTNDQYAGARQLPNRHRIGDDRNMSCSGYANREAS